jgi:hypothetical protein
VIDANPTGHDDIPEQVARLRIDLDELKGRQFIASDSFESYGMESIFPWDIASTLSEGERQRFLIRLDYDRATEGAITRMNAFYRLDDPDVMADPMPRQSSTNPNIDVKWRKLANEGTYATWELIIVNTSAVVATYTGYVKLFFTATAPGVFSIELV